MVVGAASVNPVDPFANASVVAPLRQVAAVLAAMDAAGIRYCHWKSNYHIAYAITGREDVDILIAEGDFPAFIKIICAEGFRQADSVTNREQPGVFHFLGNDAATGTLLNFHTYTRILTGDHFMKSWALPFEPLLLAETFKEGVINLPPKASEIIVYVIRNMLKHTTLFDLYLVSKAAKATREEFLWLTADLDSEDAIRRLARYFPEITRADFLRALDLIGNKGPLPARIRLGFRFARALGKYRRYSRFEQTVRSLRAAAKMALSKFGRKEKHMSLLTGGKIIALVGPQATGKSTIASAIRKWLGAELAITYIHTGKPPMTWLTFLPGLLIPIARSLLPGQRSVSVEIRAEDEERPSYPLIFVIRKVLLAWDRRALLRKAFRLSRNGKIVLSDRYPSDVIGAIDGATFADESIQRERSGLKRWLMQAERNIYSDICPPDLVLQLTVSVEKAVERNRARVKSGFQQTEDYVKARHAQKRLPRFHRCPVISVSTDDALERTLLDIKQQVWSHL